MQLDLNIKNPFLNFIVAFFKGINKLFKLYKNLIAWIGLNLFSLYIAGSFIYILITQNLKISKIIKIFILTLLIFILSFLAYKLRPQKFTNWNSFLLKNEIKGFLKNGGILFKTYKLFLITLFNSPIAIFLMSLSLSLYTFSLIDSYIKNIWDVSIMKGESIYNFLGDVNYIILLSAIIVYGISFIAFLVILSLKRYITAQLKTNMLMAAIKTLIIFLLIIIILFTLIIITLIKSKILISVIDPLLKKLSITFVKIIIGILPLGWVYELFIGSIWHNNKEQLKDTNSKTAVSQIY